MSKVAAKRYAQALYELVDAETQAAVSNELQAISKALQDPQVSEAFANPRTPMEFKEKLILSINPSPTVQGFLKVMLEKRRLNLLSDVAEAFQKLVFDAQGKTTAEVISAVPLTSETLEALRSKLSKLTGKQVELEHKIDASLWGGLVIRCDGRVIDGSLSNSLQRFKQQLLAE